jgi:hypothetical protein
MYQINISDVLGFTCQMTSSLCWITFSRQSAYDGHHHKLINKHKLLQIDANSYIHIDYANKGLQFSKWTANLHRDDLFYRFVLFSVTIRTDGNRSTVQVTKLPGQLVFVRVASPIFACSTEGIILLAQNDYIFKYEPKRIFQIGLCALPSSNRE